jgi:hypothetical protein
MAFGFVGALRSTLLLEAGASEAWVVGKGKLFVCSECHRTRGKAMNRRCTRRRPLTDCQAQHCGAKRPATFMLSPASSGRLRGWSA